MKKTEKNYIEAVSKVIPTDMLQRIEKGALNDERTLIMTSNKKKTNIIRYLSIAVAACLVLAIGIAGFGKFGKNPVDNSIVTVIDIDVNPSIEISANKNDVVVKVKAVNEDAKAILDGMKLEGTNLDVAINALIGSMARKGLLDGGNILVTVYNDDAQKAKELRSEVVSDINASLKSNNAEAGVINQTVSSDKSAEAFASEHKISLGKATFVLNLAAKDSSLVPSELAKMSLRDIASLVNEKKIDIRDIVDYDADDSVFENIVGKVEDDNLLSQVKITAAEAKEKALAHAGVNASGAAFIRVELDDENGKPYFDVDFRVSNTEYEYEIDATTGEVIKVERETFGKPAGESKPQETNKVISVADAKQKALNKAGITDSSSVRFIKAVLERDDGKLVYDIKFILKGVEYEVELNAETGAVLDYEVERFENDDDDDDDKPVGTVTLTKEQAKEKALERAGLTSATFEKVELDRENGRNVYEVEFYANGTEYDCEVDASTGAIVKFETERSEHGGNTDTGNNGGNFSENKTITAEQAKEKALQHAGLTTAKYIEVEFDNDDGRAVYDVEFVSGGYEYSYEIDAKTGAVIDFEKEIAD